jgi:hypothetical protein
VTDNKTLVARDGTRYNYLTYEDTYYFDWGAIEIGEEREFLGTIRGDEIFHSNYTNAAIGGVWTVEGCPDDSFLRVTRSKSEFWYIYVREDIDITEICWDNVVSVSFSKSDAEPLKGEALAEFYNDIIGNPKTYESYEELTKFADQAVLSDLGGNLRVGFFIINFGRSLPGGLYAHIAVNRAPGVPAFIHEYKTLVPNKYVEYFRIPERRD